MSDRILQREGARLRWRLQGSGPALVLLHGWALDLEYWDPLVARLPQFTVLRFDRAGFGLSEGVPDIHRNVADLAALLDAARLPDAVLVGMSQGARLAIHFALQQPARARALLLDGAPALEAESELPLEQYRRLLTGQGPVALQAEILRHPLMRLATDDAGAQGLLTSMLGRYLGLDLLHPVKRGSPPRLPDIAAPTLLMNGALDAPTRQSAALDLQAKIPNSRRLQLAGAGHLAALDDPDAYARAIVEFCAALPPQASRAP